VQRLMIDLRVGNGQTTGKIAARNFVHSQMRTTFINWFVNDGRSTVVISPLWGLFDEVYTQPRGVFATQTIAVWQPQPQLNAPTKQEPVLLPGARLDVLQEYMVVGPTFSTSAQPALLNITRRTVYTPSVTMASLRSRAEARLAELRGQQLELLQLRMPRQAVHNLSLLIQEPAAPGSGAAAAINADQLISVQELLVAYARLTNQSQGNATATAKLCAAQGCTSVLLSDNNTTLVLAHATLPDDGALVLTSAGAGADATLPPGMRLRLAQWAGNTTAYMVANLGIRAPQYVGQCVDVPVQCARNSADAATPFTCTHLPTGASVPGTMASASYRQECELPCNHQLDCNTLCECFGTCGTTQACECEACTQLPADATGGPYWRNVTGGISQQVGHAHATFSMVEWLQHSYALIC
jgi:hypothetical protein